MINLGPDGEQSSQLIEMIRKFPTTGFLAGRLKEVGWESDYGQCLFTQFREDLVQECGDESVHPTHVLCHDHEHSVDPHKYVIGLRSTIAS